MYFLNYIETDLSYIYNSNLKLILLKQNVSIKNINQIALPQFKYYFIFRRIVEVNLVKMYINIMLLWLLTGKVLIVKNFFNKLDRGVRYYRFLLTHKDFIGDFVFVMLDFLINKLIFFTNRRFLETKFVNNIYYLKISNLEYFSNIRLSGNFYSSKLNDIMYIYLYFQKYTNLNLKHFINNFKFVV